jgi:putative ABC transport system permease protein
MTSIAHDAAPGGRGGIAARRAVIRWAWRLFRREWRQQILVVTLLTVAVAAAISSVAIAYNSGADTSNDAEFGSASQLLELDGADPRRLAATLDAAEEHFGTTDVIGHRSLAVPGGVDTVEFRAQDPRGAYGGVRLALRQGSYPKGPSQVAVSDGVATLLGLELGKTLDLDGRRRTVVGIVENPKDLGDEFALVSPSSAGEADTVTVLVDADDASVEAFFEGLGEPSALVGSRRRDKDGPAAALAMFSVATVFLLLASLVATAGFAVIAQRRLRQLGMLAAIGATEKHLRLVLLANGAFVGVIGAVLGAIVGFALWVAVVPTLEPLLNHRLDRLSLPWALLGLILFVAVLGAAAAAWWPGRAVSRVPVTRALSGRPPVPKPARRSAIVGAVLIAAGVGALVLSDRTTKPLIVGGIVATILGTLVLGPLAIRLLARAAERAPIAVRLALRDLARYQARSGAALAAITLALGIAATVVIISSAEAKESAAAPPNLSDRQIRVYTGATRGGPEDVAIQPPAQLERMAAQVRRLAGNLGGAAVIPLHNAYQLGEPSRPEGDLRVQRTETLLRKVIGNSEQLPPGSYICVPPSGCYVLTSRLYVATPALLRYLGVDPASVDPSTDFLVDSSVQTDGLVTVRVEMATRARPRLIERAITNVQRIESRKLFGAPSDELGVGSASFITLDGLRRRGWKQIPSGWLVESPRALTSEQVAEARDLAAGGLTIETRRESTSFATPIAIAIGAGALLALAILAMTVGLIRSESAGDLRTLTATGATSSVRRTLTAATAGGLALLGALLGVAGAYLMLAATYFDKLDYLGRIPVLYLVLMVVGIPVAAAAAGWLLAGRQPPTIARPAIQ